jgi:hypothetical protein
VPLQIQTARFAQAEVEEASETILRAEIRYSFPEAHTLAWSSAPLWLCQQIFAVNLATHNAELMVSHTRVLQRAGQIDEEQVLEFAAPDAGRYRLQAVAFLLDGTPQIAVHSGPLLRVAGDDVEETAHPHDDDANDEATVEGPEATPANSISVDDSSVVCAEALPISEAEVFAAPNNETHEQAPAAAIKAPELAEFTSEISTRVSVRAHSEAASHPRWQQLAGAFEIPLSGLVLIGLAVLGFSFPRPPELGKQQTSVLELERTLQRLQAIVQRDSARVADVQKILTIMERHSPAISAELKLEIATAIQEMTVKYSNLDLELICATITHETGRTWHPRSISPVGARGLMQIMPFTGEKLARAEGISWSSPEEILFDPILNVRLGCRYLSALVQAYNIDGGLAAYNGGEKRAERWLQSGRATGILAEETSYYVPSILKLYAEYRRLRG